MSWYNNGTVRAQGYYDASNLLFVFGTDVGAPLVFKTNGTEGMRLGSSGGVSIGTATSAGTGNLLVNGYIRGNLYGGGANQFLYQTAANTSTFLAAPTTANQVISYNGSTVGWAAPNATVASGTIYENSQTILADNTMTTGNNGMSAGPIEIATGITVTIPDGSNWIIN